MSTMMYIMLMITVVSAAFGRMRVVLGHVGPPHVTQLVTLPKNVRAHGAIDDGREEDAHPDR